MPKATQQKADNKKKGTKLSELGLLQRTDSPEYIKSEELAKYFPFTIYSGKETRGRFGERINFKVAFKIDGELQKRDWTPTANEDRRLLLHAVRSKGAITNCRLIEIPLTGGDFNYWKVVDADENLEQYFVGASEGTTFQDVDIPF